MEHEATKPQKFKVTKGRVTEMQIDLNKFIVRYSDGSLDLDSTLNNLSTKVVELVEAQDMETMDIAKAVHAVFDTFKGSRLNTSAVVSFSLQHLSVTPESAGDVTSKIQGYLKDNSGEKGSSLFSSKRGRKGGIARWDDVTDE